MQGEFIRGDGLVIPNNVTKVGARGILQAAFQGALLDLRLGLCNAVFSPTLQTSQIDEAAVANGYVRQSLAPGAANWPTTGELNGVPFTESKAVVFTPTGTGFDRVVSRMFLALGTDVFSLSGLLPAPIKFLPTTPVDQRTFRYRLYLG